MRRFFNSKRDLAPEEEILRNRYVMGGAACISVSYLAFDPVILGFFVVYLSLNAALHAMRRQNILPQEWRCYLAIALDLSMAFAVMMRSAETMSFFYPLLLWVILGNGFRFGLRFLVVSSILSVLSFGIVVMTTHYWAENRVLGYSLIIALIAIPAYSSTLIKKLSKAKEEAEAASRAKSYFLASVSHELRTPLNAIIGYGNHLKQMDIPKKQHDMVEASVLAGEHLLHLIDQLIQIARSDSSSATVAHQPMRLTELLTEIRDIMIVRAEDKSIALHIAAAPLSDELIDGPADIVRNILLNLTGNAIKFTESGSVSINGGIDTSGNAAQIWFTVADTGIGIAADAIGKIFEPFQQADDTVMDRFGGTGLGLAICRQLVGQVGGSISVESILGRGSSFTVRIPIKLVEQREDATTENEATGITQIIAIGQFDDALLERAQAAGSYSVRKIDCSSVGDLQQALLGLDLEQFNIAMLDDHLAAELTPEDQIWQRFAKAEVAPVLVSNQVAPDLGEVSLRAAFASVIPANAGFDELRSAIRIGCSFAHRPHFEDHSSDTAGTEAVAKNCSVLVADDNRTNRNILAAILETAGHSVTQVCDGDEMLEILEKERFDIVLLDVNMPRLNGIDACAMWRQIEGGRNHLPIVGVTADATSETETRCLNAGMDLRLTKPINAKLLLSTINMLCASQNASEANVAKPSDPLGKVVPIAGQYKSVHTSAIDTEHLDYLHSIGGESFVIDMVDGFLDDVAECIATMRSAVRDGDAHQFRFAAHAFKSSSNNIGAKTLADICASLEKTTESEFTRDGEVYLSKVEAELAIAIADLKNLAPQIRLRSAS
jgi:two-component system sensor histidine kinase RpfC